MARFTVDQVTEALEAVVAERGRDYDYLKVFENCVYYNPRSANGPTGPACIVGATYSKLGVSDSTLRRWNDNDDSSIQRVAEFSPLITPDVVDALREAQRMQDSGRTWGYALDEYKRVLNV